MKAFDHLKNYLGDGMSSIKAHQIPNHSTNSNRLYITWMGTAGIHLKDDSASILIDPFVTRPSLIKTGLTKLSSNSDLVLSWLNRMGVLSTGAVLVSHSHMDHILDAPNFARLSNLPLIGSQSTLNAGKGQGVTDLILAEHKSTFTFGNFKITFLDSQHGKALFGRIPYPGEIKYPLHLPARVKHFRHGTVFAIVIEHPEGSLLHHGSADVKPHTLKNIKVDTVLLGLAGREDTDTILKKVVDPVKARRIIPIHWDHFFDPIDKQPRPLLTVALGEFFRESQHHHPLPFIETLPLGYPRLLFYGR